MRIISGNHRGRKIVAPAELPVRPTTDFAKTGLFNILSNKYRFHQNKILDLFAGTGSLSFEFLSRGAINITSVDKHPGCVKFIRKLMEEFKAPPTVQQTQSDVLSFLERCTPGYDIIVADPPFAETPAEELLKIIFERNLLTEKGIFILEHSSEASFEKLDHFTESRKYGNITFSFFK